MQNPLAPSLGIWPLSMGNGLKTNWGVRNDHHNTGPQDPRGISQNCAMAPSSSPSPLEPGSTPSLLEPMPKGRAQTRKRNLMSRFCYLPLPSAYLQRSPPPNSLMHRHGSVERPRKKWFCLAPVKYTIFFTLSAGRNSNMDAPAKGGRGKKIWPSFWLIFFSNN